MSAGCHPTSSSSPERQLEDNSPSVNNAASNQRGKPLSVGDALPPISAGGWINGAASPNNLRDHRLVVVDIWAMWCPYCRMSADDLVRVYRKYSSRGVAFVSVTNMPRASVEVYVREFAIPWPNGYELNLNSVLAMASKNSTPAPGYELVPTLYIVGPDGRIRWSDRQGRYRHTEPKEWAKGIEAAIDAALAASSGPG